MNFREKGLLPDRFLGAAIFIDTCKFDTVYIKTAAISHIAERIKEDFRSNKNIVGKIFSFYNSIKKNTSFFPQMIF